MTEPVENLTLSKDSESSRRFMFTKLFEAKDSYFINKERLCEILKDTTIETLTTGTTDVSGMSSPVSYLKESKTTANITDEEKWVIESLPTEWTPNTKKSRVIAKLQEKNLAKHEDAINKMFDELIKIQNYIEFGVRVRSQEIKEEFEIEKESPDYLDSIKKASPLTLDRATFTTEIEKVRNKSELKLKRIQEYFEHLTNLEKERVAKIKVLLRETYTILHGIGYLSPYDTQKFMENQIAEINQTTLTNFRLYEDICFKLQLENQNHKRNLLLEIQVAKREWRHQKREHLMSSVHAAAEEVKKHAEQTILQANEEKLRSEQNSLVPDTKYHRITIRPPAHLTKDVYLSMVTKDLIQFGKEIQATIDELDNTAREMINLYKSTLTQVYNKFYINVAEETLRVTENDYDWASHKSMDYDDGILHDITVTNVKEPLDLTFEEVQVLWRNVFDQLQTKLHSTYIFVRDSCNLWDSHHNRVEENQRVVRQYLAKTFKTNDLNYHVSENKINTILDQLREASSEDKLERYYSNVQELLKQKENLLRENYQKEIEIARKYKELCLSENDVILSEIEHFLTVYKKSEFYGKNERVTSQVPPHIRIPKQLKICDIQIASIGNWRHGLYDTMENFKATCLDECNEHVKIWLDECYKEIDQRKNLKTLLHNERYDRIKNGIYKDRLLELRAHYERYQSHEIAIHKMFQKQAAKIVELRNRDKELITHFQDGLLKLQARMMKMNTRAEMIPILQELKDFKLQSNDIVRNYEGVLSKKLLDCADHARQANVTYMEGIKLFSNGGNYSSDEAKMYQENLQQLEFRIRDEVKTLRKQINMFDRGLQLTFEKQTRRAANFLDQYMVDVKFLDRVVTTLERLKDEIKHNAFDVKFQTSRITTTIDDFIKMLSTVDTKNLPNESHIEAIQRRIDKLMKDIENLAKYLQQLEIMFDVTLPLFVSPPTPSEKSSSRDNPLASKPKKKDEKTPKSGKGGTVKVTKSKCTKKTVVKSWCRYTAGINIRLRKLKKKSDSFFLPTDYRNVLFPWIPRDVKRFVGHICYIINEAFTTIQNLALRFYRVKYKKPIIKKNLIQPTYEKFMKEIIYKCKYFHIQAEELWLSIVRELVSRLTDFKNSLLKYANIVMEKYGEQHINNLTQFIGEFADKCEMESMTREKKWFEIHDKLKPIYGFPSNSAMLDKLNTDVMTFINNVKETRQYIVYTEKRSLVLKADFHHDIVTIHDKLTALLMYIFHEEITSSLMSQIYRRLEEKKDSESKKDVLKPKLVVPEEYRISIGLEPQHQFLLSHVIVDYEIGKIEKLLDELQKNEASFKFEEKLMDAISQLDSKFNFLEDCIELNVTCLLKNLLKSFANGMNYLNSYIQNETTTLNEQTDMWIKNWQFDVEEVRKLYDVVYK